MAKREKLKLNSDEVKKLTDISKSRSLPLAQVQRSKILLLYHDGHRISEIARSLDTNRPLVERIIDKAFLIGALNALHDLPRRGRSRTITDDAISWILSLACQKPKDIGYASETWTYKQLAKHIRDNCQEYGYSCLTKLRKGKLHTILSKSNIKPHKIDYYLENRDPDFDVKMTNVLFTYKEVEIQNENSDKSPQSSVTISYDEKPGIQAIKNIAADLLPVPGKHKTISRDYEYKRLGTVSLLAGIDLHTGKVIPLVKDRHRSKEFVEFLEILDDQYPKHWTIRVILDNHSAHISKETNRYLKSKPGRYQFVFTPKHGSWLNLIEMFFSKVSRSFLRAIRVKTKEELVKRIYQGIEEINQDPVVFRWKYKMDELVI